MKQTIFLLLLAVLAVLGCKPDRGDEAYRLENELIDLAFKDLDRTLARLDSAEQAGLYSEARANVIRACIYSNIDKQRIAEYYATKAIEDENLKDDTASYCTVQLILADFSFYKEDYDKSMRLANEVLLYLNHTDNYNVKKSIALTQMARCEYQQDGIEESEKLYKQSIDILMEETKDSKSIFEVDPLVYTIMVVIEQNLEAGDPKDAITYLSKADIALDRLIECTDDIDNTIQRRTEDLTILRAITYAMNGDKKQAETEYRIYQKSDNRNTQSGKVNSARYLAQMGRYDEAVRMINEADSLYMLADDPLNEEYVRECLQRKMKYLYKAGHQAEAQIVSDRINELNDSLRHAKELNDLQQMKEIQLKEREEK